MKSILNYILESLDKTNDIPSKYIPQNEKELSDLLGSFNNTSNIDEFNEFWTDTYKPKYCNKMGPWKLLDDQYTLSDNTVLFGDHYGIGIRGDFSLLYIEKKANKGVLAHIKYNYKKSIFYNIIELMKQNKYIYNYFAKDDASYMLCDKLENDEIKKLPNAKEIKCTE